MKKIVIKFNNNNCLGYNMDYEVFDKNNCSLTSKEKAFIGYQFQKEAGESDSLIPICNLAYNSNGELVCEITKETAVLLKLGAFSKDELKESLSNMISDTIDSL